MTNKFISRFVSLGALTAVSAFYTAGATAATKPGTPLLENKSVAQEVQLPARGKPGSGVLGTISARALSAPAFELTLPSGEKVTARLQRVARDDGKHVQSWVGTFDDAPGSALVLSKAKGVVTGYGNYKDQTIEILPATNGKHLLFNVDEKRVPQDDGVIQSETSGADVLATTTEDSGTGSTTMSGTAVVQDVLILYTAAAASTWGQATLESMIQSAVQSANQAYQNSFANITLNVVGVQQSGIAESSGMPATLSALKSSSTVRSLRDRLAADMVVLISENSDYCGYSSVTITSINGVTNTDAYAAAYSSCLSQHTLAHEIGHLQRLDHNRENSSGAGMYAYSYGYRQCVTGGFRDVMSYPCASVPRVLQFSNPGVYYTGYPTGVSYEADPTHSAETARTLNNTATLVAAYRVGSSSSTVIATIPAAPGSLVAKSVAYNAISVGWADNSSNESGFKLQRSSDGVNFVEIATLGAGTVSFTDSTVGARTSYYYRVSAYNSTGGSGFSNTLAAMTPDVPPPPPPAPAAPPAPSSIAAANVANGSAQVSWTDASTTESSFEVRRETWNGRKSTWGDPATVGTVLANITSMIDLSGNGTYRYSVRAINSGGVSGFAGPAQVTVSGAVKGGKRQ